MYLLLSAQGSVENENLIKFLAQITPELVWFHIVTTRTPIRRGS